MLAVPPRLVLGGEASARSSLLSLALAAAAVAVAVAWFRDVFWWSEPHVCTPGSVAAGSRPGASGLRRAQAPWCHTLGGRGFLAEGCPHWAGPGRLCQTRLCGVFHAAADLSHPINSSVKPLHEIS